MKFFYINVTYSKNRYNPKKNIFVPDLELIVDKSILVENVVVNY